LRERIAKLRLERALSQLGEGYYVIEVPRRPLTLTLPSPFKREG
jgi:hypothetical protein